MANIKLYTKCTQCAGTGKRIVYGDGMQNPPTLELDCIPCAATGYVENIELDGVVISDILDKCNDIFEKVNE